MWGTFFHVCILEKADCMGLMTDDYMFKPQAQREGFFRKYW
jgi:hypothetical protein